MLRRNAGLAAAVGALMACASLASATEIYVTTYTDELNSDGDCSLREAVQAANHDMAVDACPAGQDGRPDWVFLPPGVFELTMPGIPDDANLAGDIDILDSLAVIGDPVHGSTIDGTVSSVGDQIFDVIHGDVEFSDLTFTGAQPSFGGQSVIQIWEDASVVMRRCTMSGNHGISGSFGILVHGDLEVFDSKISDNSAAAGAAIFCLAEGTVRLMRTEISNNQVDYTGGAIDCSGGSLLVLNGCTVTGNRALFGGSGAGIVTADHTVISDSTIADNVSGLFGQTMAGGLWIKDDWVSIRSSTISGNIAGPGAAILVGSPGFGGYGRSFVTLENVTIFGNDSSQGTGGVVSVHENEALVWFSSTTVADNVGGIELVAGVEFIVGATVISDNGYANCVVDPAARVTSFGDNLENLDSCGLSHPTDFVDTDPMLGVLTGIGGLPETLTPLPGSPVIDTAGAAPLPGMDQRHVPRPWDGDGDLEALSDRGAVEYRPGVLFADGFEVGDSWRWSVP
jgi:CSLREA domain-containing protein